MIKNLHQHWFWVIILLGVIIRVIIISLPLDDLFSRWGSDDLFYYSQIAGNIANGNGVTFDGLTITNGFQPLFLFILVPIGKWLLNDVQSSLTIVLITVSLIHLLATIQLKKLIEEITFNSKLGGIIAGLFFIHPKILSITFNGTEAALSFLFIVLSFRASLWISENRKLTFSSLIFSGLVLTRFDFCIILFYLFIVGVYRKDSFLSWFKVLILPTLLFFIWIGINYAYFDSIIPSSGLAKKIHSLAFETNLVKQFISTYSTALMSESKISYVSIALSLLGIFYITKKNKLKTALIFLLGVTILTGLLPILTMGTYRDWYLITQFILIITLVGLGIYWLSSQNSFLKYLIIIIPFLLWSEAQYSKRYMNGYLAYQATEKFHPHLSQSDKIGSFNAGIISASLGSKGTLINLDGVVNNEIIPYLKEKNLDSYLLNKNIKYLIDAKPSIDFFLTNFAKQPPYKIIDSLSNNKDKWVLVKF